MRETERQIDTEKQRNRGSEALTETLRDRETEPETSGTPGRKSDLGPID